MPTQTTSGASGTPSTADVTFAALAPGLHTVTVDAVPAGYLLPDARTVSVPAGGSALLEIVLQPTAAAGMTTVRRGWTNTAQQTGRVAAAPTPAVTLTANPSSFASVVAGAGSGAVIELAAGTYTAATIAGKTNVLIRPAAGATCTWTGQVRFQSCTDVRLVGMRFAGAVDNIVLIQGATCRRVVLDGCTFAQCGSGTSAATAGNIRIESGSSGTPACGLTSFNTETTIVRCTFLQPKNAAIWVENRAGNVWFSHCRIVGPDGMNPGSYEREPIKFGWNPDHDDTGTHTDGSTSSGSRIQCCTIEGYGSSLPGPYAIGLKQDRITVLACDVEGTIALRHSRNSAVVGNRSAGSYLQVAGWNNYVGWNQNWDQFGYVGATFAANSAAGGPYNGSDPCRWPWLFEEPKACVFEFNKIVQVQDGRPGQFSNCLKFDYPDNGLFPSGLVFTGNEFHFGETSYPTAFLSAAVSSWGITWSANRFGFVGGAIQDPRVQAIIAGQGGNSSIAYATKIDDPAATVTVPTRFVVS